MTQAEFDRLPALLSRRAFMEVTGLTKVSMRQVIDDAQVRTYKAKITGYRKYFKSDAAKLAGFKMR